MFDASMQTKIRGALEQMLGLAGSAMTWTQAKPPAATRAVNGYIKMVGKDETEIINAYGMNAKVLTVAAKDFTTRPEKFDTFTLGADRYTVNAVQDIHINNAVAFYKIILRGQDR